MAYWLLKSEPSHYSWDRLVADGRTRWDGVKNAQALNNLRAMRRGDRAFFYHSNEGREIVGIIEVAETFRSEPKDDSGRFGTVAVAPVMPVPRRVSLAAMKAAPELAGLSLLRQPRLSVCPVSPREWAVLCGMAGVAP